MSRTLPLLTAALFLFAAPEARAERWFPGFTVGIGDAATSSSVGVYSPKLELTGEWSGQIGVVRTGLYFDALVLRGPEREKPFIMGGVFGRAPVLHYSRLKADLRLGYGEITPATGPVLGLGLGYEIPLSKKFFLMPRLGYRYLSSSLSAGQIDRHLFDAAVYFTGLVFL